MTTLEEPTMTKETNAPATEPMANVVAPTHVWVLVHVPPPDRWPLPHDEFHHTPRCNTGGCHE